ncbi:MAG: FxsA family protein [Pseudomonadota bacterium]
MWLFLLLVAVPIIEIALFIEIGGWLGLWPTLAIVVLTALIGTMLLRRQGTATLAELQMRLQEGGDPTGLLAHGALILVAGIVLLTPGFFTDAVGFALLVPPVRAAVIRFLAERMTVSGTAWTVHGGRAPDVAASQTTIDGDYADVTPPEPSDTPGDSGWTKAPGARGDGGGAGNAPDRPGGKAPPP